MIGKISYSTYIYENYAFEQALLKMAMKDIHIIEIFGALNIHWSPYCDSAKANRLLKQYQIDVEGFHLPIVQLSCLPKDEKTKIHKLVMRAIDYASDVGAKNAILHAALPFINLKKEELNELIETIGMLAEFAQNRSVRILIENIPGFGSLHFGTLIDHQKVLAEALSQYNVGICIDTGHSHINNEDVVWQLKYCNEWVGAMHLSDNHGPFKDFPGASDEHLAVGMGTLDWNKIFETVNECVNDITLTVEVSAHAVAYSSDYMLDESIRRTSSFINKIKK